jgi:hypothetical protein
MTIRDHEVLEELRDDPELLALADAVVETQRLRRSWPFGALATVALAAAALFVLVLASPWDRGGESGSVLDRALAAVPARGPVTHLTGRIEITHGKRTFSPLTTESFYDKRKRLVRLITRSEGRVLADYTTVGEEDEFTLFPGLLDGAAFYREALASGRARVVDDGVWQGRPVYWLELKGGGGAGRLRIGIDRESYQPLVFVGLDQDGSPAGFQAAVLGRGLDYVPVASAGFQTDAPILVSGRVLGPNCEPVKALVGASISDDPPVGQARLGVDAVSTRTTPDGRFTLRADPKKSPFREALSTAEKENGGWLNLDLNAMSADGAFGYWGLPRFVQDGAWWGNEKANPIREAVTIRLAKGSAYCD